MYITIANHPGGTQILSFTSTGHQSNARRDMLPIRHGTEIHVTVVSENAAGLSSVVYSDPIIADLTPPTMCCIVVRSLIRFIFILKDSSKSA